MSWVEIDRKNFALKAKEIQSALCGDTGILLCVDEPLKQDIFYMLLFCLCVPQSKAVRADEAIQILRTQHDFYSRKVDKSVVLQILRGRVRFHYVKADRLLGAKTIFLTSSLWDNLKSAYNSYRVNPSFVLSSTRDYLVEHIPGMGMKLASQFLRNIGMPGLAILDVHILGCLRARNLIDPINVLTKSRYNDISKVMHQYAKNVGVSLDELDLLFWSERTGFVFK